MRSTPGAIVEERTNLETLWPDEKKVEEAVLGAISSSVGPLTAHIEVKPHYLTSEGVKDFNVILKHDTQECGWLGFTMRKTDSGISLALHTQLRPPREQLLLPTWYKYDGVPTRYKYDGVRITAGVLQALERFDGVGRLSLSTASPSVADLLHELPKHGYSVALDPRFVDQNARQISGIISSLARSSDNEDVLAMLQQLKNGNVPSLQELYDFRPKGVAVGPDGASVGQNSLQQLCPVALRVEKTSSLPTSSGAPV